MRQQQVTNHRNVSWVCVSIFCVCVALIGCGEPGDDGGNSKNHGGTNGGAKPRVNVEQLKTPKAIAAAWHQAGLDRDWKTQQQLYAKRYADERAERYADMDKRTTMLDALAKKYASRVLAEKSVSNNVAVFEIVVKGKEKTASKDVIRIQKTDGQWRIVGVAIHIP